MFPSDLEQLLLLQAQVGNGNAGFPLVSQGDEQSFIRSYRSLNNAVKEKIQSLEQQGVIKDLRKEIDSRALQQLACLSPEVAVAVLDQLSDVRFEGIENKTSYLCGLMSSYKCFGPSLMTREKVDKMLQQLFDAGIIEPADLDNGCRDALMLLPEHLAQHVVNEFSDAPVGTLRNVSAFFMSIVRRILKEAKKTQPDAMAARRKSVDSALRNHHMLTLAAQSAASPLMALPRAASTGAGMMQQFQSTRRSVDLSMLHQQAAANAAAYLQGGYAAPTVGYGAALASDLYGGAAAVQQDPLTELSLMLQEVALANAKVGGGANAVNVVANGAAGGPKPSMGNGSTAVSAAQIARPMQQALASGDTDLLAASLQRGLEWLAAHEGEVGSGAVSSLVAEADRMLKARAAYAAAAGVRPPMPGHWETLSPSNSNPALVQATSGETYNPGQGAGTPPAATPSGQGQGQTVPPSYASSWSTDAAGTAGGYGLGVFAQSGQEYPGPEALWSQANRASMGAGSARPSRSSLEIARTTGSATPMNPMAADPLYVAQAQYAQQVAANNAAAAQYLAAQNAQGMMAGGVNPAAVAMANAAAQRRSMEEAAIALAYRANLANTSSFWN